MNDKMEKLINNYSENYIMPFLWLHGEPEKVLREYMTAIYDSNIRAVCVESRPHPDFCGSGWWRDMDIILDEAKKKNMKIWILDDSHFPTGYANGQMKKEPDEMRRQSIVHSVFELKQGETLELSSEMLYHVKPQENNEIENYLGVKADKLFTDDRLLGVTAIRQDMVEEINLLGQINAEGKLHWTAPEGSWKVHLLQLSRNYGYHREYINMLKKDSCRVLIDAVYEPHYEHYQEYFGNVIAGFFSDEPELGNGHLYEFENTFGTDSDFPWSEELEDELQKLWKKDFTVNLAYLWENNGVYGKKASVRYQYMNVLTNLVKKNFSMQIGTWCRTHGVQYIGHLIEDDGHHSRTGSSLGHYFRGLAGQDMAGIDDIGGQVFPNGEDIQYNRGIFEHRNGEFYHYTLGKLASSLAAIDPLKNGKSVCEIFGNYGWQEGLRLEKYLADHFMVRGINHFVPHAFSAKEFPDPDCPPHFYAHGHNPQYRHFRYLMDYMNRICELINDGRHIASVALLYDGEGDWTGKTMRTDTVGHCLADHQIEYDIIPEDTLLDCETYHTVIAHGQVKIQKQQYRVIIIPYRESLSAQLAKILLKMSEQGVMVAFAEAYPEVIFYNDDMKKNNQEDLLEKVKEQMTCIPVEKMVPWLEQSGIREIELKPDNQRIRYLHYIHTDETEIYFFVNEGNEKYTGTIHFQREDIRLENTVCYDPWNNQFYEPEVNGADYTISLESHHTLMLIADKSGKYGNLCVINVRHIPENKKSKIPFSENWFRSKVKSIDYPKFEEKIPVELPDTMEIDEPRFSGMIRYENTFHACVSDNVMLEISDAGESVEVFINQKSLGVQVVPPFVYDLTGYICDGDNQLMIEVATTLERELAVEYDYYGNKLPEPVSHTGINGTVILSKYE